MKTYFNRNFMKSLDQMLAIILNEETELPPKVKLCALRVK